MGTVTVKVALAPFACDWVGGDIGGLAQLAGTLYGYAPQVNAVAAALNAPVRQVVGAAGWQGNAASAFTAAWERDSLTAQALALAMDQVAGIVGWLAMRLSQIEAGLEQGAGEASAHGVPVGADGAPPQVCYPGTGGPGQAAAQQWLSGYQAFYAACMQAAQGAREQAATALAAMARQIVDSASTRPADIAGNATTAADLLYDLLAGKSGTQVEDVIKAIQKAWYGSGSHTALGKDDAGAGADDGDLDLGALDVLTAGIGTILNTYEDVHYYHRPLLESLWVESGASEAGLALPKLMSLGTADAAGGEATAGEAAADGLDPLALAGVVISDQIHNAYLEPWPADVHEHGVVMGIEYGQGDVTVHTLENLEGMVTESSRESLADLAVDNGPAVAQDVEQAWDDVF
jgi:uncharacterized protein YukE